MPEITITVDDAAARAALDALPSAIDAATRAAMGDAVKLLLREVKTYPPPPDPIQGPSRVPVRTFTTRGGRSVTLLSRRAQGKGVSWAEYAALRYKRTMTLAKSWSSDIQGGGGELVGRVASSGQTAPYNRYVQDSELQARVHQGRWATIQEIAARDEDAIQQMFRNRIMAALG